MIKGTEAQVEGLFRIEVFGDDGHYKDYGWTKNMILDAGIEYFLKFGAPTYSSGTKIFVGTGTTPPQPTDTGLENKIAETSAVSRSDGYDEVGGFGWTRFVATFGKGRISTGVSEVGVYYQSDPYPMVARSLFRDADGTPITIPMTADNTLVITYEFRTWWITPAPYVIDYDNNGTIEQVTVTHGTAEPDSGIPRGLLDRFYLSSPEDDSQGHADHEIDTESYFNGSISSTITSGVGEHYEIGYIEALGQNVFFPPYFKIYFNPPLVKTEDEEISFNLISTMTRRE